MISSDAATSALTVISSSALKVTVVGSIAALTVISSAASKRIAPLPVNLAFTSIPPDVTPATIFASPTTAMAASSVTSSLLNRVNPDPARLTPAITIELSSSMPTTPAESNIKPPALSSLAPRAMDAPETSSRPATSRLVAPASDTAATDSSAALPAALLPTKSSDESSPITTAPTDWKVSEPKSVTLPESSPN